MTLAKNTLASVLKNNPDLDDVRRKIALDKVAPALAKLYDEMDAMRQR
jgi:hypothetical protein